MELCHFFLPVIGESLEVNHKNLRELPKIKFLRCLNKVLASGAVPRVEGERGRERGRGVGSPSILNTCVN